MKKIFSQKGITFTELLVYVAVFSIVFGIIISFFLWTTESNTKIKAKRETLDNSRRAMEIIGYEIKNAKSVYTPTSTFGSHPGQLSLETTKYLADNETNSYIDFFLCGTQLCMKKESQVPIPLTSEQVVVSNLIFTQVVTSSIPSIQINLRIEYNTSDPRPAHKALISATSTFSLRSY